MLLVATSNQFCLCYTVPMLEDMQQLIASAVRDLYDIDLEPQVSVPDEQFGDVASNVAMQLAKQLGRQPREIAQQLAGMLQINPAVSKIEVAGPGFLNIRLHDAFMWDAGKNFALDSASIDVTLDDFRDVRYTIEYSCPNWFKELHTGHLYQTILGDAVARIVERAGARVSRTTFGGDVGLHVAKALWSIVSDKEGFEVAKKTADPQMRASFITKHYVAGSTAYENDEATKQAIKQLNKQIYELQKDRTLHPEIAEYYFTCRDWSAEYFHYFYKLIHVDDFDRYYPESETEQTGLAMVEQGLSRGVFEESDGAVVYRGEKDGLHTRVFRTREGLPTYEAKDLGVIVQEKEHFDFGKRILITGADQKAYMQVVWAALYALEPEYRGTMTHLTNGIIKFADGSKMSSRLGNVARGVDVIEAVSDVVAEQTESEQQDIIVLGAIKYEFLKYSVGSDISFDVKESVSTKGNSGPYLQYAYVRAKKIINSADTAEMGEEALHAQAANLDQYERRLVRALTQYKSVFAVAARELSPNTLCQYLYELAQVFNQFYENDQVIGSERTIRVQIVSRYLRVLEHGLSTLGIELPEQM